MKNVLLIATGGTIACVQTDRGLVPGLSGEELLASVPEAAGLCHLDTLDLFAVDSTNIGPSHWISLARAITGAYDEYDAFVVTHGTDTMAYTAAALSYLVQGSAKPIVLTGSQLPMGDERTDAKLNLLHSLLYATDDSSHDVALVFGGMAIAGTRATKRRTRGARGFESVNFPALATFGDGEVLWAGAAPASTSGPVRTYDALNDRVLTLKLVPGCDPSVFEALAPHCDALVIEGFGMGGIPSAPGYREAIAGWLDSGRVMAVASQAPEGGFDLSVYGVGRTYVERGGLLVSGDMTTEAVVTKIMWALGQTHDCDEVAQLFDEPVNCDRVVG